MKPDANSRGLAGAAHPRGQTPAGLIYRRFCLLGLGAGIFLALVMNGASSAPYRQIAVFAITLPVMLALFVHVQPVPMRRALRWVFACLCIILVWSAFQIMPQLEGGIAHPVWDEVIALGLHDQRHISISPAQTMAAVPSLVLPFLVFAAMLILCQTPADARFGWNMLAGIGAVVAMISLGLHIYFPETNFFSEIQPRPGTRLGGVFVNANMTAALLGLSAFALSGVLFYQWDNRDAAPRASAQAGNAKAMPLLPILLALGVFLLVIALIMTRSRAGVALGIVFLTFALALHVTTRPARAGTALGALPPFVRGGLAGLGGLAVLLVFGEPFFSRIEAGMDDLRYCTWAATWTAFRDHPVTGTGFGTFAEMFPRYRDPDCLGTSGVWLRAHNSYLEFLAGFGVGAVVVLALGFAFLLRILHHGVRVRKTMKPYPIFALGAMGFVAGHSFFDFPLQIPGIAAYFAALMGAGCAISLAERLPRRSRSHRTRSAPDGTAHLVPRPVDPPVSRRQTARSGGQP